MQNGNCIYIKGRNDFKWALLLRRSIVIMKVRSSRRVVLKMSDYQFSGSQLHLS